MSDRVFLTILMPCLDEARTLPSCIRKAQAFLARAGLEGEILVADNGSSDDSREIAQLLGARVIAVAARGYGNALRAGIEMASGKYVIMGDADDSYDFLNLDGFVRKLEEGYDLVVGNRFAGGIMPGAMPTLHRYVGNPMLSFLGRMFFGSPARDLCCGLRGFRRDAILSLGLNAPGMEFALEMIVKASINRLSIAEVPTTLSPDGRDRRPHLRTFRDGCRSLRFYLLMCPRWLFLYPGALLAIVCGVASGVLLFTDISIGRLVFSYHSLILTAAMTNIGVQSVFFWAFAIIIGSHTGLLRPDAAFANFRRYFALERALAFGSLLVVLGLGAAVYALVYWYRLSFGEIAGDALIKTVCGASFLAVLGFQLIFSSFFVCLLDQVPNQIAARVESDPARRTVAAAAGA
jgi:glycosyltransferase involved in cell wall biosynthesis